METSKMGLLAKTRAFLGISNPAILKIFVISSSATLTSGIALAVEWLFHGRSHAGFGWIIYYALFLICLPLLFLIGLRILMAVSCSSRGSSQIVDSVAAAKEPCADVSEAERTEVTERNSCRSLAVVVDSDERKKRDEKTPRIKRAVSFPSHGKPIEIPVGVTKSKEGHKAKKSRGEVADFMDEYVTAYDELDDVSDGDDDVEIISGDWEDEKRTTSGVKRRAGKEIAPSGRYSRSVSLDFTLNGMSSYESPGNASGLEIQQGVFSVAEMETIESSEKLKGLAVSNPKHVKRILANRRSAARSKQKKVKHLNELRGSVEALQKEAAKLSAKNMLLDRSKSEVDEENKQLKIRVQGLEDQAKLRDALINQLTGEVQRLKVATGEVMQNLSGLDGSNTQSMDADMFEQLKINQEPQINLGFQ